jgi:hypothetical protein
MDMKEARNRYETAFKSELLNGRVIPWTMKYRLSDLMRVLRRSVESADGLRTVTDGCCKRERWAFPSRSSILKLHSMLAYPGQQFIEIAAIVLQ